MKTLCNILLLIGIMFLAGCNYDEAKARNSIAEDTCYHEIYPALKVAEDGNAAHLFVARKKDGSVWFYVTSDIDNKIKSCTMIFGSTNVNTNENR